MPLIKWRWWVGLKKWISDRAKEAGEGFDDLHQKIKDLGPLLVGVVGLLLLVGVTTNDVLPALVRNAPLQMAVVSTLLVGLPLLAVVFREQKGSLWAWAGTITVLALCLVIFTAAWSPTAATAPALAVDWDDDGNIVVTASSTRLQNDETLHLKIDSAEGPCEKVDEPVYGELEDPAQGEGSLYAATSNGDGTGEATIAYTFDRSLVTTPWLCVWARAPERCGWVLPGWLGGARLVCRKPLDSYSFVYLN